MALEWRLKGKSKGLAGEVGWSWSWIMCWMMEPGGSLACYTSTQLVCKCYLLSYAVKVISE